METPLSLTLEISSAKKIAYFSKKKKKKKKEEKKIGMQKEHRKYNFKVTLHYQTNMMTLNEKLSCYGFNSAMNSG